MVRYEPQDFVGLKNYITVLSRPDFMQTLKNTVMYVVYSLIIGFPLPFFLALIMNEIIHFRKTTRVLVYLPSVMPGMAVSLLWVFAFNPAPGGLMNMALGQLGIAPYQWLNDPDFTILWIIVSMTWNGCGATALYYFAGMQGINRELYEAALIDGAGYWRRVMIVTLPHMYGMLILFAVRQIIGVFNVMEQVLQMTGGGPNNASVTLGLLNYRYAFDSGGKNAQYALALGVMMFVVLSVFAVIYFILDKKIEENQM
jgi:multiple sugar transport system permease protein